MNGPPLISASREVLRHHARQHTCEPGWRARAFGVLVCSCETTALLLCDACRTPLYLAALRDEPPCRHTRPPFDGREWTIVPANWLLGED